MHLSHLVLHLEQRRLGGAMHAEARRIQERVRYTKDIEAAMLSRTMSMESESEPGECLTLEDDPDEWWRDLQDGKPVEIGSKSVASRKVDLSSTEATEARSSETSVGTMP